MGRLGRAICTVFEQPGRKRKHHYKSESKSLLLGFISSSSCSSLLFTFESSEFSSSSISNRLANWCKMITELDLTIKNRTGIWNDKSARGDETAHFPNTIQNCGFTFD